MFNWQWLERGGTVLGAAYGPAERVFDVSRAGFQFLFQGFGLSHDGP